MGIARSTYYDASSVRLDNAELLSAITAICDEFEAYGWRRVQAALRHQGVIANHKRIKRLMQEHDLQPRHRRRYVATTDSDHDQPIFPDRARNLVLDGADQLWVSDLTYVAITDGFAYVAIILDAWSRRVVGYAIGRSIDARLAVAALKVRSNSGIRRQASFITPTVDRNMRLGPIANCSPIVALSAQ
jgi:putative transposase